MNYDEVLPHLSRGNFGKYQTKIYILLCLPSLIIAFHNMSGVFILAVPDHRCKLDGELSNASFKLPDDILNYSIPFDNSKQEYSKCEYFRADSSEAVKCSEFIWDESKVESSAVKSFALVCDRGILKATAEAIYMFGILMGCYCFGSFSDKFGRRPAFMLAMLIQILFGFLTAFAPEYLSFVIFNMIVGTTTSGAFLSAYCLSLEMVRKESRNYAGTIILMFFSTGYMLVGAFAYFIHNWRWLKISLTLPSLLFLSYWWFIPESNRWLLVNNQKGRAFAQIEKIAKTNKVNIPKDILNKLVAEEDDNKNQKKSLFGLFKSPKLRIKSLLIFFYWFVICGAYYGLSWNTSNLGGNEIINFVISGAVELPANFFLLFALNRLGRKPILMGGMISAGGLFLISIFFQQSHTWIFISLIMLGKMTITASFTTVYIFSAEQFPTVIRNVAIGAASMSARFGGMITPYVFYLSNYWQPAPFLIYGIAVSIAGISASFLSETVNRQLPETLADGDEL
ncbi:CLUMA_CG011940, isoform A [Clunio marinus]|uniref:CLUMA_CG011940, isoform A n=1 Tax=Clunio marinus TaxID=568069 RepID=A0A1J1IEB3_9DIPT|nr:CLUMA_CG011940, isoform A [Clunio marinus]